MHWSRPLLIVAYISFWNFRRLYLHTTICFDWFFAIFFFLNIWREAALIELCTESPVFSGPYHGEGQPLKCKYDLFENIILCNCMYCRTNNFRKMLFYHKPWTELMFQLASTPWTLLRVTPQSAIVASLTKNDQWEFFQNILCDDCSIFSSCATDTTIVT